MIHQFFLIADYPAFRCVRGDSSFLISYEVSKITGLSVKNNFTYRLSQRARYHRNVTYSSYLPIMEKIAKEISVNVTIISRNRINTKTKEKYVENGYLIVVKSLESRLKLINYLERFPLLTSKYLDYSNWKEAQNIVNNKQHKKIEGIAYAEKIINLKNTMNTKRDFFDWKHLENFLDNL